MSDPEDASSSPCNTTRASPASAAPSRSSTTAAVPHEDEFCERRRQQNREAQRRFRNKKNKEREAAAAVAAITAPHTPTATLTAASLPRSSGPVVPPRVSSQDLLPPTSPLSADPFPAPGDLDLYPVLAYPSATSNHDTHDYFGHVSFPEFDALLNPYHSTAGDESTLFAAASSIVSPPTSYPPFDTLQHPSYSFTGLEGNSTAAEKFGLDALFGRHSRGQSMGDQDFGWNPHSSLATPRRALEDPLPTPGPSTASTESYPAPSTILPGLRPHPEDQQLKTSTQPSRTATAAPPTPASSRKHTPLPTRVPSQSPSESGDSSDSKPLLHISIDSGHQGVVRMLLDSGVDINERDRDGSTALHLAVQMRQDAIIRLLLERGALTSVKDSRGKTPTHLAIYSNFETGLKVLLDHDACVEKRK